MQNYSAMIRRLGLPNTNKLSDQQPLLDRAQEDLICAIFLHERNPCGYYPASNICYLLHQSIEKSLKALLAITGKKYGKTHSLHELFDNLSGHQITTNYPKMTQQAVRVMINKINSIKSEIEGLDPRILDRRFQSNLRYDEVDPQIDEYIKLLMKSALKMQGILRYIIKKIT